MKVETCNFTYDKDQFLDGNKNRENQQATCHHFRRNKKALNKTKSEWKLEEMLRGGIKGMNEASKEVMNEASRGEASLSCLGRKWMVEPLIRKVNSVLEM